MSSSLAATSEREAIREGQSHPQYNRNSSTIWRDGSTYWLEPRFGLEAARALGRHENSRTLALVRRWVSRIDDAALVVVLAAGGWFGYQAVRPTAPPAAVVGSADTGADGQRAGAPGGIPGSAQPDRAQSALTALESLAIKGRAPKTGYERRQFGNGWVDVDRNGCDTRNDMLRRDLEEVVLKPETQGCVVASGTLVDPYSGERIAFVRGNKTSTAVQIDHVVALSDAWQKGAQQWDSETRVRFANDPLNLLAVGHATNQAKGDGDAATWLPPAKSFRCAYTARQVEVKAAYALWLTQAEHDAISRVLGACPAAP